MTHEEKINRIIKQAKKEFDLDIRIISKKDSKFMMFLNFIFNFLKGKADKDWFIRRFTTVIGQTIYLSVDENGKTNTIKISTLLHETRHMLQAKKYGFVLYAFLYLWPLSQGTILLLTCWLPIFWASGWVLVIWICSWCVFGALHFVPQLPDPWREKFEFEGYEVSLYVNYLRYKYISNSYLDFLTSQFVSISYYQMSTSRTRIKNNFRESLKQIKEGKHSIINSPVMVMYRRAING